ncbi:MAG: DUF4157 domain-containing protein, partial [Leptolyngbyaceae cyanobacterium CAN_BIN12]|nr:DUF4157 domain-containing protein [Leptolyngbyaceae cyanobacterium CAN_BIN12]
IKPNSASFTPVPIGLLQRKCASCGQHAIPKGECAQCQKKTSLLQRRSTEQAEIKAVPGIVHRVLNSPGQPLAHETRTGMESHFGGHDFSQVRVHTDSTAAESARAVSAHAYTVRHNVVFGANQYAPDTDKGRELLAHELTHVVQQSDGTATSSAQPLAIGNPSASAESEAETIAQQVQIDSGGRDITHHPSVGLQRQPDNKATDRVTLTSGLSIDAKLFAQMMAMCDQGRLDPVQCIKMEQAAGLLTDPSATPSRFGQKPLDLGAPPSNKLPSAAEIQKILDESNKSLGALGIGKPILPPSGNSVSPANTPAKPAAGGTSSSPSLDELLSFKFDAGPVKAEVELPKSAKLKLPLALTKAKMLTIAIQAESSKTFSASITLDGLPDLRVALKAQIKVDKDKGNTGSAGLEIQTTRTVCSADNPEGLKAKINASGEKLTKAMKELETAKPDERLEKLVDIAGAIGDMYAAIDKSKKGCKEVPIATFNFGVQGPLSDPAADKIDPDPLKRPAPFIGGSITIPL